MSVHECVLLVFGYEWLAFGIRQDRNDTHLYLDGAGPKSMNLI
jgi:hypothetical protein